MIEAIRCPNCGSIAERHHLSYLAQVKTQCDACDYLLVMCTRSSHVIESYAPGLPSPRSLQPIATRLASLPQRQVNNSLTRRDIAALQV
jgi:predicted RNA-binding Zn-ribbon protein involved in translation (DUF1610 family)